VIFEMDLDTEDLDEKLSEIVDELFEQYDKGSKGYLDLEEFGALVKEKGKEEVAQRGVQ
jgi:Ca2+-binding EF-hand superfamily protein